jgi:hypothetical protein
MSVCDGARVRHGQTTRLGPAKMGPSRTDDQARPGKNGIIFCFFVTYYIFEVTFFYLIYLSYFLLSRQTLLKM